MKRLSFLLVALTTLVTVSCAQKAPASPRVTAEGKNVKVAYGQPSKKGRVVFGGLEKFGSVWRTGANEATEITFATDGKFGGQDVKAGTYTLFTIPGEKEWSVILNSSLKQWGAYNYDKIKDKDVLNVKVPVKKLDAVVEKLIFRFSDAEMFIEWDQTQVAVPVAF